MAMKRLPTSIIETACARSSARGGRVAENPGAIDGAADTLSSIDAGPPCDGVIVTGRESIMMTAVIASDRRGCVSFDIEV